MINDKQSELALSEEIMRDYVGMLVKYGFAYKEAKASHDDLTGDDIRFIFENKKTCVILDISYNPTLNNNRRYLAVTLEKKGEKERLYLDQYLKSQSRNDLLDAFMDRGRVLSLRAFWGRFIGILDSLLANELKGTVEGTRWDGMPYDWDWYR